MNDQPIGWATAPLISLVGADGLFTDGDWVESKDQDPEGGIRLLQLADIGDGRFLNKSARFINDEKFVELRCTQLAAGDVLVARMPDPLGRACLMPELPQACVTVVDVAAIRLGGQSVKPSWLMHTINAPQFRQAMAQQASGTTRKRISRGNLAELPVPVPPRQEQQRIADKLDTVLARVEACRDRIARVTPLLKRFRQSVLAAAFSGRLTQDWRSTRICEQVNNALDELGELLRLERKGQASPCDFDSAPFRAAPVFFCRAGEVSGGLTKNPKRAEMQRKRPYLRVANVYANELRLGDIAEIGMTEAEFEKTRLQSGDLLIVEGNGSIEQIGRVAIWEGQVPDCSHQNHLIRWRAGEGVLARYALLFLLSPKGREQIEAVASSTTGLHTLSVSKVGGIQLPVAELEEQAEIVRRVETLFAFADRLEARLAQAQTAVDRLTPSLLAKAFRGELVPQDPNDEPAADLLKRLRASPATLPAAAPRRRRAKAGA